MKKLFFTIFAFTVFFSFFSCSHDSDDKSSSNSDEINNENVEQTDTTLVEFINNSSYSVSVYYNDNPYYNESVFAQVDAKSSVTKDFTNGNILEVETFYFVYNFDFGLENCVFPYFSKDPAINHKGVKIREKTKNKIVIDEISKCATKSAFLLLENKTTSVISLSIGSTLLRPYASDSSNVANDTAVVYEIGDQGNVLFETISNAKINKNAVAMKLPEIDYKSGEIYTVVVTNDGASLKSISPFDIDTRRQIWTSEPVASQYSVDCVRSAYDVKDGSFYAGSVIANKNTIFIEPFDVYGKASEATHKEYSFFLTGDNVTGDHCKIVDAVQTSNGNYLLLVKQYLVGYSEEASFYYVLSVDKDGSNKKILKLTKFAQDNSFENVWFETVNPCKGVLCPIGDDKCGIFGSLLDSHNKMYFFAALADFSSENENPSIVSHWKSPEGTEVYKSFTSGWYDDTSSSFYVTGYDNFSGDYTNPKHKGVIYKISSDFTATEVADFDRTLFFGITGKNGQYYACGETMGSTSDGNLYGGFISKDMVDSLSEIIRYRSTKENTYFTQINFTNNGIALCGSNSSSMDFASDDTEGILTCFSTTGTKLWENNYSDYHTISSMAENNIGTQILHVVKTDGTSKILSTDLLGRECK